MQSPIAMQQQFSHQALRDYSQPGTNKLTLNGHCNLIHALTVLPDGRLASGSYDETIKLWDVHSGQRLQILSGHIGEVLALTMLADGRLASGSSDKTIKLWDVNSGQCLQTLSGHSSHIYGLTVLPDGRLASGSYDKTIKLWDVNSGQCLQTLSGHSNLVCALTVLPDGRLASGSYDKTIKLWDVNSGQCLQTLGGHSSLVFAVTVLLDGRLASGSYDNIKLWDVNSGQCLQTLSEDSNVVRALTVLPDGRLASSSLDKTIKLWDVNSGQCLQTLSGHNYSVFALTVLPDGRLVSGSGDMTIKLWDFPLLRPEPTSTPTLAVVTTTTVPLATPLSKILARANRDYEEGNYSEALQGYRKAVVQGDAQATHRVAHIEKLLQELKVLANEKTPATVPTSATIPASSSKYLADDRGQIKISIAIPYEQLTLGKELGRGAYGVVYQGDYRYSPVAIKKLLNQDLKTSLVEEFKQEVSIMANLRSAYVVQLYGACFENSNFALVMEYCPKGSLFNLLQSDEPVSWQVRYQIGLDVGCGLAFLHSQGIIHADMKSLNVLLDNHYRAKISDFGLAKVKTTSSASTLMGAAGGGSIRWMAPELFEEEGVKNTKASDVFSYGMVLWELGARKIPFATSRNEAVPVLVMKGKREAITPDTPPCMAQLITRCWEQRAEARPSMEDAVKTLRDNQREATPSASTATSSGYRENLSSK